MIIYILSVNIIHLQCTLFLQIGMKHPADLMDDEPQSKKLRTEDSLIPEQQFLMRNKVK